ncbi:MAG: MFS transporter [Bauldia sp.]
MRTDGGDDPAAGRRRDSADERAARPGLPQRYLLPLIVACALFIENLDSTVLSTSLAAIAADFDENPIRLKLALTSYLLALAVSLPASGWLADRFGAKHVFRLAISLFLAGSIWCGLSSTIAGLVAGRIVQGVGGAMMVPVGRLVILRTIPRSELVGALAWLTVPALIGPVVGPPLGGFITTYFEWRWIFWINLPIGLLGIVLATLYLPNLRGEQVPFDRPGFLMSAGGLAALVTASTTLGLGATTALVDAGLFAVGAALLIGYWRWSRIEPKPILDLSLFRLPTFRGAVLGGFLFRMGVGATPFLLPLMMQLGFGLTPFQSGSITFVSAVGAIMMKFAAPPILRKFGFRRVLIVNAGIAALFVSLPAAFRPDMPFQLIVGLLLIGGFFRSMQFTASNALAFAEVPEPSLSQATTLASVFQQVALSLGITVAALALQATVASGTLDEAADFGPAFVAIAAVTLASLAFFLRLPRDAGREMSGHSHVPADPVTDARERG